MGVLGLDATEKNQSLTETDISNLIQSSCATVACQAQQTNIIEINGNHDNVKATTSQVCDAKVQCAIKTLVDAKAENDIKQKEKSGALALANHQQNVTQAINKYNSVLESSCGSESAQAAQMNWLRVNGSYDNVDLIFDQTVSAKSKCELETIDKYTGANKVDQSQEQAGVFDFLNNPWIWIAAAAGGTVILIVMLKSKSGGGGGGGVPYPVYVPMPTGAAAGPPQGMPMTLSPQGAIPYRPF